MTGDLFDQAAKMNFSGQSLTGDVELKRMNYYYFSPEVAGHAAADRAKSDSAYDDLIRSLDKVLKDANFEELPHEEVTDAHRKRTLRVEVKAEHDDFRAVRFYKRGRHVEQLEVKE